MNESEIRYEKRDINPRYALYFAVSLVVMAVFIHIVIWWMLQEFEQSQARRDFQPSLFEADQTPPEPRLQVDPQADYEEVLRTENRVLESYEWIDRERGTARIPIDRAMELFLKRGKK
jgi:hypothetical protein